MAMQSDREGENHRQAEHPPTAPARNCLLSLTGMLKEDCGGLPFGGEDVVIIR